jgi:excisionase family DNA binding protein
MTTVAKEPYLLTTDEAAAFLGVSRATIYRYIRDGKLVPSRRGRALLISRSQLEWLQSPASKAGIVLRDYTDEEIAQFLHDDVLTPEQQAIMDRIRRLDIRR